MSTGYAPRRAHAGAHGRGAVLAPDAIDALRLHPWPGNFRELRNVLERALLGLPRGAELHACDLRLEAGEPAAAEPAHDAIVPLVELERQHILRTLARLGGNASATARALGIPRSSFYERLKQLGVSRSSGRSWAS